MSIPILILVRHGEISHPEGILFGQIDFPLSGKGVEQMQHVAHRIFDIYQKFNHRANSIIHFTSSDLTRCSASLHYIMDVFYDKSYMAYRVCETGLLREYHLGEWEGLYIKDIRDHILAYIESYKKNPWHAKPPYGESHYAVAHRVRSLVNQLNLKYLRYMQLLDQTIPSYEIHLWVVHEGSARMAMQLLNVDTHFRTQDVESEFIHDEHQLFFKRGDIIILKPVGVYKEYDTHGAYAAFPGSTIPDALNRSLHCFTAWSIIDHIQCN